MFKKVLCLLLACLMILPWLVSCSRDGKKIDIVAEGGSEYTIICPAGSDDESKAENKAGLKLYSAIKEKTGVTLSCSDDTLGGGENQPETATEILVGATNRLESQNALTVIRAKDFTIQYANGRVIILGGCAEATSRAVDHFIENYINGDEKTVTVFSKRNDTVEYAYALGRLSVNGVSLSDYTIVYPAGANSSTGTALFDYYTALCLSDYIYQNAGIRLNTVADSTAEAEYEILVGATKRSASKNAAATALKSDEYLLMTSGTKIVMLGNSYMVGGAANALINTHFKSQGINVNIDATDIPTSATPKSFTFQKATSAILMIGDGMGNNHIEATLADDRIDAFVARELPYQTFCTTSSQSVLAGKTTYTDSAAAATALATGYKTYNGYVGLDASKVSRRNIRELAHSTGAKTGVLTTDAITGATPAGFLCHHNKRSDTKELQSQISQLTDSKAINYCKGSVTTLANYARDALNQLSTDGSNFFIMIEEAHIDKRAHYANMQSMQDCVARYNECIAYTIAFVMLHPDTALIITADHETGGLTLQDGKYVFENLSYTEADGDDYYQHTDTKAPAFGIGDGVEDLLTANTVIDNTDIAKFIANIFGDSSFGQ
ncbi:MAG: alkaline phosphatase [Clostridia bacterium]|nr:alkaline phosphatase [Clostridia bacterium]